MKLERWFPEADFYFNEIHNKKVPHSRQRFDEKLFKSKEMKEILSRNLVSADSKWMSLARSVPRDMLEKLVKAYQMDFDLFGYSV